MSMASSLNTILKGRPATAVVRPEHSRGMRITALAMVLLLVLVAASYVPTNPIFLLMAIATAGCGSYLAYIYREKRPAFIAAIPTVGICLLFTNFFFELYAGYLSGGAVAAGAFVHMMVGLMTLHTFDLRTRTDFSISALIGLALLTALTGLARDSLFAVYIFIYSLLGGSLLFFDSASRSRDLGPTRNTDNASSAAGVTASTLGGMLPIVALPVISFIAFIGLPRPESFVDLFVDNMVRANFPISANLGGQLGKGGRSQSIKGGTPHDKHQSSSSYMVQGGDQKGQAGGTGSGAGAQGQGHGLGGKNGMPGGGSPEQVKAQQAAEQKLRQAYDSETVDLSQRTFANAPQELLLKIASPSPTYLRLYALNFFDGRTWSRRLDLPQIPMTEDKKLGFDLTRADAYYVPPNLPTLEMKQEVRIEASQSLGHFLPASWLPQIVKLEKPLKNELRTDADGSIKLVDDLKRGSRFDVISQVPVYDLEVMRHLPFETLDHVDEERASEILVARECLALPPGLPEDMRDIALSAAGREGNWFVRAENIANFLRKNYAYSSERQGPTIDGNLLHRFIVDDRKGDCRHFAAAMVVMCRAQGIPARMVVGFKPGTLNKESGYYQVHGRDAHAWVEVYVPYWNWVPFDATPGGALPSHQEGDNAISKFIKSGLANPFAQPYNRKAHNDRGGSRSDFGDGNSNAKKNQQNLKDFNFGKNQGKQQDRKIDLPFLGAINGQAAQDVVKYLVVALLSVALLGLSIFYWLERIKARRLSDRSDKRPATVIFLDVLDELKRYQIVKGADETADELASRLSAKLGESTPGIQMPAELPYVVNEFMGLYYADRFGGQDNLDSLQAMAHKIKTLAAAKARK